MQLLNTLAQIINTSKIPQAAANQASLDKILSIVFGIAGAVGVLMVVIGGLRYITAQGDPSGVAQAKKTIIYSIVGVIVTMLAYTIVRFIVIGIA